MMCIVCAVNAQQTNTHVPAEAQWKFAALDSANEPLLIVDGKEWEGGISSISPNTVESFTVLKGQSAIERYGEKAKNGVVIVTTKLHQFKKVDNAPLIFVDGEEWEGDIEDISPDTIESITILKDQSAVEKYGEGGKNGVVIITTKSEICE